MYNFCTLFDSNYSSRGISLYYSLEQHCSEFTLYIFAFDSKIANVLKQLNLKHAIIIPLSQFEDLELLKVKPTRSIAEYCWTSTSSTILYVLENYGVESCTYLDADLFFYDSPKPLFDEMGDSSILLTEHRYSPEYNKELKSGKYCVQYMTFKNDERGLTALRWWRERCLEWCYNRFEDGKFGDQLYLDDWTTRFEGVHELQNLGGGLAAWNIQQYQFSREGKGIKGSVIETQKEFSPVFYHFHYLRFINNGTVELGRRTLTDNVLSTFYVPYIKTLLENGEKIKAIDSTIDPHGTATYNMSYKTPILWIYRNIKGVYNIFPLQTLLGK